jgi:hypothetical protein
MNRTIFWRVFWKEYRLQRPLWIAMAVLSVMATLLVYAFVVGNPDFSKTEQLHTLLAAAVGLPALYLLGCGAALFAGEHEAETYEFQRSLPTSAGPVFAAKVTFALVSDAAMLVPMWLLALALGCRELERLGGRPDIVAAWATLQPWFALQMFAWAAIFSLLLRRVLVAAVLGVAFASVVVPIASRLIVLLPYLAVGWPREPEPYVAWTYLAICLAAAVVDVRLGLRWFRPRRLHATDAVGASDATAAEVSPALLPFSRSARATPIRRLVWQHLRQSGRTMLILGVLFVPAAVMGVGELIREARDDARSKSLFQDISREEDLGSTRRFDYFASLPPGYRSADPAEFWNALPIVFLALAGVPLVGAAAFTADQRRRSFRFLTDRGVPPKQVWRSRQALVWLYAGLLVPIVFVTLLLPLGDDMWYLRVPRIVTLLEMAVGSVVLGIAVGQFCSMLLRSSLLTGVLCVPLTAVLASWCCLMAYLHVNWLWSALPIPIALLLATRLRTEGWLVERNDFRAWVWPAVVVVVPTVAVLTAFPLCRAYEYPLVDPGFSVEEFMRPLSPDEKATLDLYREASVNLWQMNSEPDQRESEWIAMLLKASRREMSATAQTAESPLLNPRSNNPDYLPMFMMGAATMLQSEGKLDAALDEYLAALRISAFVRRFKGGIVFEPGIYLNLRDWAVRPHQAPERLIAAARQIEEFESRLPVGGENLIRQRYIYIQRFLSGDPNHDNYLKSAGPNTPAMAVLWWKLPWERIRGLRLLNLLTHRDLNALSHVILQAKRGEKVEVPEVQEVTNCDRYLLRNAILPWEMRDPDLTEESIPTFVRILAYNRATVVTLALEARKLQHGSLPKSLNELVGPCLDRLPVDPYTGKPFVYLPAGEKVSLIDTIETLGRATAKGSPIPHVPPNTPILWSPGAAAMGQPRVAGPGVRDLDAAKSGWAFPIP